MADGRHLGVWPLTDPDERGPMTVNAGPLCKLTQLLTIDHSPLTIHLKRQCKKNRSAAIDNLASFIRVLIEDHSSLHRLSVIQSAAISHPHQQSAI
jgi:hypothetical protein